MHPRSDAGVVPLKVVPEADSGNWGDGEMGELHSTPGGLVDAVQIFLGRALRFPFMS